MSEQGRRNILPSSKPILPPTRCRPQVWDWGRQAALLPLQLEGRQGHAALRRRLGHAVRCPFLEERYDRRPITQHAHVCGQLYRASAVQYCSSGSMRCECERLHLDKASRPEDGFGQGQSIKMEERGSPYTSSQIERQFSFIWSRRSSCASSSRAPHINPTRHQVASAQFVPHSSSRATPGMGIENSRQSRSEVL